MTHPARGHPKLVVRARARAARALARALAPNRSPRIPDAHRHRRGASAVVVESSKRPRAAPSFKGRAGARDPAVAVAPHAHAYYTAVGSHA
eukprot:scaffold108748_cov36-Tisochrysis_lutea.AAC.4